MYFKYKIAFCNLYFIAVMEMPWYFIEIWLYRNWCLEVGSLDDAEGFNSLVYFSHYLIHIYHIFLSAIISLHSRQVPFQCIVSVVPALLRHRKMMIFSSSQKMLRCLKKAIHPEDDLWMDGLINGPHWRHLTAKPFKKLVVLKDINWRDPPKL